MQVAPELEHLDHDDVQTEVVRGFSHARCNVRAAALKANARRKTSATFTRSDW